MFRMTAGLIVAAAGLGGWWGPISGGPVDQGPAVVDSVALREVPPPARLQGDPADSLYRAARESLTRRDFARAAELFGLLPDRYPTSGYAPDALYWRAFALYRLGGEARLREALSALRQQGRRFPEAATVGDAQALERRIQGQLARGGDQAAAAEVQEAARAAVEVSEDAVPGECDEDGDMKLAALNALMHMDPEQAKPILQRVLARRDAGSACLRRKAVFLLAQGGGTGVERALVEAARTDPDGEVREQAVFWLSQVEGDAAVTALDSILRTSADARVQEKALFALSQHESLRARQSLRAYAERSGVSAELREKAIFWIAQSGRSDDAAYLRTLFAGIGNDDLRNKLLFSISQMGGAENMQWLLGIARDRAQPVEVRKQALFLVGQGGAAMSDLGPLYDATDERAVREHLLFIYSQREDAAAFDKLLEIGRRDPDPEMRKKALLWLGQSDDPRAARALQAIIEQP